MKEAKEEDVRISLGRIFQTVFQSQKENYNQTI